MLLTITTTHQPATDLGYLLHKNPYRVHQVTVGFGKAYVFYPEASDERCTAALMMEVDPVGLVRNRRGPSGDGASLEQYVNDRPYVASSFMSVALASAFATALGGRCSKQPELCETAIPLEAHLPVLPCRGGETVLRSLFEPLGYLVETLSLPLDEKFPEWGQSRYVSLKLSGTVRLADLLSHLYVLMPVLDDDKHYWVGDDEVQKLLEKGASWLPTHPARDLIVSRYLRHQKRLARSALERLVEDQVDPDAQAEERELAEELVEAPLRLHDQRLQIVAETLSASGAKRVLDLGCGSGKLLQILMKERGFEEIVGMDVSTRSLEIAENRLHLDRMPPKQRERIRLIQGSLIYRDARLTGYDAAAVVEVIEHLDASRLAAFERVLFEFAQPATVVVTTPNSEYNALFPSLPAGTMRHADHRFEWTREEFGAWAKSVTDQFGYSVELLPIGPVDDKLGAPTQMAVFRKGAV